MPLTNPFVDPAEMWAQVEERLAPTLRLDAFERALYYYLLKETVLRGRRVTVVTYGTLLKVTGHSGFSAWRRVQRLCSKGCARIVRGDERSMSLEVRKPTEVLGRLAELDWPPKSEPGGPPSKDPLARRAIFRRECGQCFYCFRQIHERNLTVDHVVPTFLGGEDSLTNLVACCFQCNFAKGRMPAVDFLRLLYRRNAITLFELRLRVKHLKELAEGRRIPSYPRRRPRKRRPRPAAGGNPGLATSARMI